MYVYMYVRASKDQVDFLEAVNEPYDSEMPSMESRKRGE